MDDNLKFHNLAPKDNLDFNEEFKAYHDALYHALNDPKVKNIAITGCFSSGKSSIIESFIQEEIQKHEVLESDNKKKKKNKEHKKNNEKISNKYLKISLANFLSLHKNKKISNKITLEKDNEDKNTKTERYEELRKYEQLLEKSIIQQIFYSVSAEKVPSSIIKNKLIINQKQIRPWTFVSYLVFVFFIFFLTKDKLEIVADTMKIYNFYNLPQSSFKVLSILFVILFILILYLIIEKIIIWLRQHAIIKKINFFNTEIEVKNDSQESVFNKYLDEIIYFFSVTEYGVVIFEDLERFEKLNIFSKLRELNTILNNNETIIDKKKSVKFIYAINDEMLNGRERVKFFDFIIPVIPILTTSNAKEKIKKLLEDIENNEENKLEENYIDSIAEYIGDMRLMKNIVNEYNIFRYSKQFIEINSEDMQLQKCKKLENLFSMVVFKNCYPIEFLRLQEGNGFIYNLLFNNLKLKISCIYKIIKDKLSDQDVDILSSIGTKQEMIEFLTQREEEFIELTIVEKDQLKEIPSWQFVQIINFLGIDEIYKQNSSHKDKKLLFYFLENGIISEEFIKCLAYYYSGNFSHINNSSGSGGSGGSGGNNNQTYQKKRKQDSLDVKEVIEEVVSRFDDEENNQKNSDIEKEYKESLSKLNQITESIEYRSNLLQTEYFKIAPPPKPANYFIGRENELTRIDEQLKKTNIIIVGMGGIGKTETIKKYLSTNQNNFSKIAWFEYKENLDKTLLSYAKNTLDVSTLKEELYLLDQRTLLVFDDVKDLSADEKTFFNQLPCKVILTSRFQLIIDSYVQLRISTLSINESINLFMNITNINFSKDDRDILNEIVENIGFHPQAITILAKEYKSSIKYNSLHELKNSLLSDEKFKLLENIKNQINLSDLSMEQIYILKNICLLHSVPIQDIKLKNWIEILNNEEIFDLSYKGVLIYRNKTVLIHKLIAEVIQSDLSPSLNNCRNLINNISKEIEYIEYDQEVNQEIIQHNLQQYNSTSVIFAEKIAGYFDRLNLKDQDLATFYHNLSKALEMKGQYNKALYWSQKALVIREKVLGKEHPDTAVTYNNIADVYADTGDYPQALAFYEKSLEIKEKVLGKEHPSTATTYHNIARVYDDMGDYPQALSFYQKALGIRENVLGKEHPNTAATYNNIALVYQAKGNYPQALTFYQKALAIREKVLGKEHPSTATTYNNIASVYDDTGDSPQALAFYEKAIAIREKVLGQEHPSTATTYNNIAIVYEAQGDYPQALAFYEKAIAIREKVLGKEHPSTATTDNNIAGVYYEKGDYPQALAGYQKSLAIKEKVLGKEHPSTATTYNNIAYVYKKLKENQNALEFFEKAITIRYQKLGEEHPDYKSTYHAIKQTYLAFDHTEKEFNQYLSDLLSNLSPPRT